MSTNLEYRARERQQASEAQREKKTKETFFVGRTTWKLCSSSDKMRNASGHQCKVKMSGTEEK